MRNNKHIPILWVFLLILCVAHVHAQETSGYCGRQSALNVDSTNLQWNYDVNQHVLTISGIGRMKDYDMDTKAPWWYYWRNQIQRVVIEDGVTVIGTFAMWDLSMDSVQFGNTVETLREHSFRSCRNLQRVYFPNSLRLIEHESFNYDDNLTLVDFGESEAVVEGYSFAWLYALKTVRCSKVKDIQYRAFDDCQQLVNLNFGDSLTHLGEHSFNSCRSLRKVFIPASVQQIDDGVFAYTVTLDTIVVAPENTYFHSQGDCNAIVRYSNNYLIAGCRNSVVPAGTLRIHNNAFEGCSGLQSIVIPGSVTSIGSSAFWSCTGLQTVTLNEGLQRIDYSAFYYCSSLQSIVLPESMQSIDSEAFGSCYALQSANFPDGITNVGCRVFNNCTSLHTPIYNNRFFVFLPIHYKGAYSMPNTIQVMCCGSMCNCDSVTAITLSERLKAIPSAAFENCIRLTSVTIKDSVTSIESSAFNNCCALASIVIPDAVTNIGSNAFSYCSSLNSITFPANLHNLGEAALNGCTNLQQIIWNAKDAHLSWIFYNNYSHEEIVNNLSWNHPFYDIRKQITSFVLGDSVRVVPRYLCYGMENLTSISFGCGIDSIENHVLDGCTRISSVQWNIRTLHDPLTYSGTLFYPIKDNITVFTFGDSVQHIPAYLCHGMSKLSRLYIPKKVSSIGEYAFRDLNRLDSIYVHDDNLYYDSRNHCNALIESAYNRLILGCYKTQIPEDIVSIGACAFRNVRKLTAALIPETVTNIEEEAFNGCTDLDTVALPSTLTAINDYTFQDCSSLDTIALPQTLEFIGIRAFSNCTGLPNITLPASMDYIDQFAFSRCSNMEYITCLAVEPPTIRSTTFDYTSCPVYVPCTSLDAYRSAPVWSDYGTRVFGTFDYKLTVRPNDYFFGWDTIIQLPSCEDNAIVYANPNAGYEFVEWQDSLGNTLSAEQMYEFYVDEDMTVIAVFRERQQGFDNIDAQTAVWVKEHKVLLRTNIDAEARLYDITGREVDACDVTADVTAALQAPSAGVYVVVTGGRQQKVIVQ